ncbi:zinc finger BED domain-containing protein 6-like [Triplophysa rosa]|uniref:zinc finger BED domain-containing protein 6-like n=1 Tax=Triplophysa rosa TaxID=992332 RepID=UPI002545DA3E|nr:zinc finger BED domain-containing protein 6-like [Triplophysa rosa]
MLKHLASRQCASITHPIASNLVNNIHTNLQEKFAGLEKVTSLTLATLLDPRFKEVGFCSMTNCQAAVERLTRECASVIPAPAQPLPPAEGPSHIQSNSLWDHLDSHVDAQRVSNCTASAIAEVQRYLKDKLLPRMEDPLKYWLLHKAAYPYLYRVALQYLSTPASSVPLILRLKKQLALLCVKTGINQM